MNHVAIVLKQLREKADKARAELAGIEAAIMALGGTAGASAAPKARGRRRGASTTSSTAATGTTRPARARVRTNGADSPELIEQLKKISADTTLTPIQKAQASRKARAAAKRGDSAAAPAQGAILGEAASAEA